MPAKTLILLFLLCFLSLTLFSQNNNILNPDPIWQNQGAPFMKAWNVNEFEGGPQNFAVTQDHAGNILVGNSGGIFIYNGTSWSHIKLPRMVAFSLACSEGGIVYVGSESDLGYIYPDSSGKATYHSLLSRLPEESRNIGSVWGVFQTSEGIYFQSFTHLIRWNPAMDSNPENGTIKIWSFKQAFSFGAVVRDQMYYFHGAKGLMQVKGDSLEVLPGGSLVETRELFPSIWSMLPYPDPDENKILIATQNRGLLLYDGKSLVPFECPANRELIQNQVYLRGILLQEGIFAYNTLAGGIFIIDRDGTILRKIDTDLGLSSNTCLHLYQDVENNLWTAQLGSISRIEIPANYSVFPEISSEAKIISYQDKLYTGDISGIRWLSYDSEGKSKWEAIPGFKSQVMNFQRMGDDLLVLARDGVFNIHGNQINNYFPSGITEKTRISWTAALVPSKFITHQWYLNSVMDIIVYDSDSESISHRLIKLKGIPTAMVEDQSGVLWIIAQTGELYRLSFDPSSRESDKAILEQVNQKDPSLHPASIPSRIQDQIVFPTSQGLKKFDEATQTFISSDILGEKFTNQKLMIGAIHKGREGKIFIEYVIDKTNYCSILKPDNKNGYEEHPLPIRKLFDSKFVYHFYEESPGIYWFSTHKGLVRYVDEKETIQPYDFQTSLQMVKAGGDSVVFQGYHIPEKTFPIFHKLPYPENQIRFEFNATTYQTPGEILFQYRLLGYEDQWSEWTKEHIKEYTNLWEGRYEFQVRAKNIYDQISNAYGYEFTILAPWYRSWWAYLIYVLLISGAIYFLLRFQRIRQQRIYSAELEREREVNEKLVQVDKLKDQFLANTSHELRTPLNGIIGITESLLEKSEDSGDRENLEMVVASGKRLANLVNDLLDFSRIKHADLVLRQRPLDLYSLADAIIQASRPLIRGKEIVFENRIPWDLPPVFADEDRIIQVLYNVGGNAIKFTEKGYVRIYAEQKGAFIEVKIEDSGIGIPPDKLEAIFNAFEQGDGSVSREFAGTGLGLSISRNLVENHGGKMWVTSVVGKGSSFYFTLPVSSEPIDHHTEAFQFSRLTPLTELNTTPQVSSTELNQNITGNGQGEAIRILIVDDEPINHQVLKNHLADRRYELASAMNGDEAMEILAGQKRFDLILLDVMMPRMSGYQVCQRIREKYLPSELPIIMVTAKNQVRDLVEGLNTGANDYLAKPFSKDEFLARLNTHLNLHRINKSTSRFVPSEFIQTLGRETITDLQLGDHINRDVTVFFSDIRSYTTISEQMKPDENYHFVNGYVSRMGPIIQANHGFVNQYLGDGIMALFQREPADALNAAIEMQAEIRKYNQYRLTKGRQSLRVGMGFHTGSLIMGIIGDQNRTDTAIIADTVNTAARLEGLTKYYGSEIILSQSSFQALSPEQQATCRYLGKVQVKGRLGSMGVYECLDGEEEKLREVKMKTLGDFHSAVEAYLQGEINAAISQFSLLLKKNPGDAAVTRLLGLARHLLETGVPEDWDGVHQMESK